MAGEQAPSVALPKRIPLVLEPENRGANLNYDARLVNAYMETRKTKTHEETWIYQRPGLDYSSQPSGGSATGRGVFQWRGNFYSIFGNKLYKDGVAIAGTVDTSNGVYRFDECLGATPKMQLGNGVKAYNYDTAGGLVLITDGDFPSAFVKGWAYVDGTTYVMTASAHILGSDINDPVNWNPLNDILAQIEPDQGVALCKQLLYVAALKQWSGEIFFDAGNATGSPLGRVEGAKFNYGCKHSDSVRSLDGNIFWWGATKDGSSEICMLENMKCSLVSTAAIERILTNVNPATETVFSWVLKLDGHRFYVLTLKNVGITLAYDMDERMWSQWTDKNGSYLPIVASAVATDGTTYVQHESNGKLYAMATDVASDAGDTITVDLYTPNFDAGTRRGKQVNRLELVCDQHMRLPDWPGAFMGVRTNDEDYNPAKWSNFQYVDLSLRNPFLSDQGTFVRRAHNFRYAHNRLVMPRIQAVEIQMDLCTL